MDLAITRLDVARYVQTLITVYIVLIFIRVLLSFIPRMPANPALIAVVRFVEEATEPYLAIFRRLVPSLRAGPAALDLSPMLATIVLVLVGQIVVPLIAR